ncbi:MAG: hypothetical protein ACPHF4_12715 [Rubripirellula sp.]
MISDLSLMDEDNENNDRWNGKLCDEKNTSREPKKLRWKRESQGFRRVDRYQL